MPLIEGFRVQNYRSLRDVMIGRLSGHPEAEVLTPLTVVIGKNGAGKSTTVSTPSVLWRTASRSELKGPATASSGAVLSACDLWASKRQFGSRCISRGTEPSSDHL